MAYLEYDSEEEYLDYDSEDEYLDELQYFEQFPEETWEDAWRRMKELFEACHRHRPHILECIPWYYDGLNEATIMELDIACGRSFSLNTSREGYAFLEGKSQTQFVEENSQTSEEEPQEVQEFNPSCALPDDTQLDVILTQSSSEPYVLFPISNEHEIVVDVEIIIASTYLQVFSLPSLVPSTANSILQDMVEPKLSHSQPDLGDMTMEEFLDEFMEPGDVLSKIVEQEVELLSLSLMKVDSKDDDTIIQEPFNNELIDTEIVDKEIETELSSMNTEDLNDIAYEKDITSLSGEVVSISICDQNVTNFILQDLDDKFEILWDEQVVITPTMQFKVVHTIRDMSPRVQINKEVVSRKRKLEEAEATFLIDECSYHEKIVQLTFVVTRDDPLDFHHYMKKPTSEVQHDVHPTDYTHAPFHLWLGNLLSEATFHYYHPHLNLNVGKDTLISCK